ncbi:CRISPR-associated endonuclease Cas1 [Methanosarcina mazei]|uniref:CRISPR-associated endonuclease Cas1 n=1 Tax=Methanosarcina mazei TaxID=2209 RepID=UPI0012D434CD
MKRYKEHQGTYGSRGNLVGKYCTEFSKAVTEEYAFCNRIDQFRRAMGSGDMVNTMLNYGYSLLEVERVTPIAKQ